MFERVVVGLDGSDVSEEALRAGADLARRLGVPLHLIRVADLSVIPWGASEAAEEYAELSREMEDEKAEAQRYLDEVAQPLLAEGLPVTTEVRSGFAARELAEAVTPADLLIVASHGRHGLARWFLGSVAEDVARRASAPVLIVRAEGVGSRESEVGSR
jgi:nucleotide-binding universal stress UspA family protein